MKYRGNRAFSHGQADKTGVLLVNLGTPDAPTPAALRRYLAEFLWDPRVVEVPRPLWWLILHGVILRVRPRRSAATYRKIWRQGGSPLLLETLSLRDGLRHKLGGEILVEVGMRYGNPALNEALEKLLAGGVRRLLVLPLYPQYSGATTGSTFDALAADLRGRRWVPDLRFVSHYQDFEPYIDACARAIDSHWQEHGRPQQLLLSYHGVPRRYLDNGDPYFCECHKTSRLIADRLGLAEDDYITTFQSRFGREEWLRPYTDETLQKMPARGIEDVQVFCPGFATDCLETLEEIDMENREHFLRAGGKRFSYIPALNARTEHIEALAALVDRETAGWPPAESDLEARESRAKGLGAVR